MHARAFFVAGRTTPPSSPISPARQSSKHGGVWTKEEDEILRREVAAYDGHQSIMWSTIAQKFDGRSGKQVRERWKKHLDHNLNKEPWSKEDEQLIDQEPWRNSRPPATRTRSREATVATCYQEPWSEEMDQLLIALQCGLGNRSFEIARAFPGQSANAVRNRWNSMQLKKTPPSSPVSSARQSSKHGGVNSPPRHKRARMGGNTVATPVEEMRFQPSANNAETFSKSPPCVGETRSPIVSPHPRPPVARLVARLVLCSSQAT